MLNFLIILHLLFYNYLLFIKIKFKLDFKLKIRSVQKKFKASKEFNFEFFRKLQHCQK